MALDDHINEVLDREAQARVAEERLRQARREAEETVAAEVKAREAREQLSHASSLGPKVHLVYVGRGVSTAQRTYATRVDEWRYRPWYSYCPGGWQRGNVDVSEGVSYRKRETFRIEKLTTVDEVLFGLLGRKERIVG